MQKIGFFGGCFNPPTYAHLYFANKAIKELELDKVVFVPVGNNYKKNELIDIKHRINMLKLMCKNNNKLEVSDVEMNTNEILYAIDIFKIIERKYKGNNIFFMMGSDNLKNITKWKKSDELISKFKYIILERENDDVYNYISKDNRLNMHKENFNILTNCNYNNVNSTAIREAIKNNKKIEEYVSQEVENYIKINKLYLN